MSIPKIMLQGNTDIKHTVNSLFSVLLSKQEWNNSVTELQNNPMQSIDL